MKRRAFLATSPAFFAALCLSAKTAGALPVGLTDARLEMSTRLTLELDSFAETFLRPAMEALAQCEFDYPDMLG